MSGLKFYPASHRYKLDGQWVPGVTTILGVIAKPGLTKWAASSVAAYVADNREAVEHLYDAGRGPMVGALKEVPWQKRDDAADRGTKFHDFAERLARGEEVDVPDEQVALVESSLRFMDEWQIRPLLIEFCVGDRRHKFAGKGDMVAEYTDPRDGRTAVGIFDWKSGKAVYASTAFQLSAYAFAEFHGEDGNEKPMRDYDITSAFGIHIRADDYSAHPLEFGFDVFSEFTNIRRTYDINKRAEGDWREPGSGYVGRAIQIDRENVA